MFYDKQSQAFESNQYLLTLSNFISQPQKVSDREIIEVIWKSETVGIPELSRSARPSLIHPHGWDIQRDAQIPVTPADHKREKWLQKVMGAGMQENENHYGFRQ